MTFSIKEDIDSIVERISNRNSYDGKNCLVTGGAGFIGSWICETLLELGASVTCLDNISSGVKKNIEHLFKNTNFKFEEIDVINFESDTKFDFIFHLSSRASPEDYFQDQIGTLLTNSIGTKKMLDIAKKNNCKILFSSTSEIYGDAEEIPTTEDYWGKVNPIGMRSCYDEGKRFGEALCFAYQREHGVKIRIARIFNTYGPRIRFDGRYGRALPRFVKNALENEDIEIFGKGLQTRSFNYISDTVIGLLLHCQKDDEYTVINIGNTEEISVNQLAEIIIKTTKSTSKIKHISESPDDPNRRKPDITRAKNSLNWEPVVPFDKGLEKTISWIKVSEIEL